LENTPEYSAATLRRKLCFRFWNYMERIVIHPAFPAVFYSRLFPVDLTSELLLLILASVILTVVFASMYDFARPPSDPSICPIMS